MEPANASPIALITAALVGRETMVVTSATVTIAPRTLNALSPIVSTPIPMSLPEITL